jgi:hydroxymethylpyrimidine/phosphomethylpyrimidine kinase
VLVVGGLDPSGGAGITADARVLQVHGALALPIAVALTIQNRHGFQTSVEVEPSLWRAALAAAIADGPVHAIKLGLLASAAQATALAELLAPHAAAVPMVVDPVLSATAGGYQAPGSLAAVYREQLVPMAAVFTPNLPERAAVLGAEPPSSVCRRGCRAVLTKGGHGQGGLLVDVLTTGDAEHTFAHPRQPVGPVHGTGCALASSLAAHLAHGRGVVEAAGASIAWLQRCLVAMGAAPDNGLPRPLAVLGASSENGPPAHGNDISGTSSR